MHSPRDNLEGEEIKIPKHTTRCHIKLKIWNFVTSGIGLAVQQCQVLHLYDFLDYSLIVATSWS